MAKRGITNKDGVIDSEEHRKLKDLVKHRDNEIAILIQNMRRLESKNGGSITNERSQPTEHMPNNEEFEKFELQHPSYEWIEQQKKLLKQKYIGAKTLGESANKLRQEISTYLLLF